MWKDALAHRCLHMSHKMKESGLWSGCSHYILDGAGQVMSHWPMYRIIFQDREGVNLLVASGGILMSYNT